ncbi:MAG: SURF1 family protein [Azoarcus sp.]|nr:SURF1 family protein [Azoarcus sp.]
MKRLLLQLLPLAAGLLVFAIALQLGNWQTRRAAEKLDIQARIDVLAQGAPLAPRADAAALPEWQPLQLAGTWLGQATRLIDNRTHQGQAGYHVLTPLLLSDGSGAVLVNRGWVAAGDRRNVPAIPTPTGVQRVEGWLRLPEAAPFMLAAESAGLAAPVWQHVDPVRHRQLLAPAHLAVWVVHQTSAADDGLIRDWPLPVAGVDRHRGYAFQWYALACLAAGLCVWALWRLIFRRPHDHRASRLIRG